MLDLVALQASNQLTQPQSPVKPPPTNAVQVVKSATLTPAPSIAKPESSHPQSVATSTSSSPVVMDARAIAYQTPSASSKGSTTRSGMITDSRISSFQKASFPDSSASSAVVVNAVEEPSTPPLPASPIVSGSDKSLSSTTPPEARSPQISQLPSTCTDLIIDARGTTCLDRSSSTPKPALSKKLGQSQPGPTSTTSRRSIQSGVAKRPTSTNRSAPSALKSCGTQGIDASGPACLSESERAIAARRQLLEQRLAEIMAQRAQANAALEDLRLPDVTAPRPNLSGSKQPVVFSSNPQIAAIRRAIIGQESSGNFRAVNPHSGALGYAQIMPENLPSWSRAAVGRVVSRKEFLSNPRLQLQIIEHRLAVYWREALSASGGNEFLAIRRVASRWYSGRSEWFNSTTPQFYRGNRYPSIADYTLSVLRRYLAERY